MNQTHREITSGADLPWSQLIVFVVASGVAVLALVAGLGTLFQPNNNGALSLAWLAVVCMASWVMFAQARRV